MKKIKSKLLMQYIGSVALLSEGTIGIVVGIDDVEDLIIGVTKLPKDTQSFYSYASTEDITELYANGSTYPLGFDYVCFRDGDVIINPRG